MTILYGTGFETGSVEIVPSANAQDITFITMDTGSVNTGGYGMRITEDGGGTNWVRFPVSGTVTEMYATVWLRPSGNGKAFQIEFELTDGTLVGVRKESGAGNVNMHAYVDGVNVLTGSASIPAAGGYQLFELYVKIADSGGRITLKYNTTASPNAIDIDFTGDTRATSATDISYIRFSLDTASGADFYRIDDLTLRDDDFPGDIRYISQVPDADSAVTWTPSVGIDNFDVVDDIPPADGTGVTTAVTANQDLYTVDDYLQNATLAHVVQWVRGITAPAGGEITIQCQSGATTSEQTSSGLSTSLEYLSRIIENDPNTSLPWTRTSFNAALFGQESVVTTETVSVTQHIVETAFTQGSSLVVRPLGIDVDVETGTRIWVTSWQDGTLFLTRKPSTFSGSTSFNFGAATEAQVDARTFYLVPYAPAFFGTASLDDIVYVFGRWNDGAVTHIEKSTDGGTTFLDIGDSATWLTGWVGGFFADDTNTLYAFVNGASRALFRSLNGGTLWTNLSTLPFDVDPDCVGKHPDGRILIANRIAGAQMVAYADSAYSSWTNATGSPAFSTTGGGARSMVWVT